MIFALAGIFALLGLYNLYIFSGIEIRVKFTKTDLAVYLVMLVMFGIYQWAFKPNLLDTLAIGLALIFWNYSGVIGRGFGKDYLYTNKLNPFLNKKVSFTSIKSVTISRAEKNLLLTVNFKEANAQDNMRFAYKKERDLVKLLREKKIKLINAKK